MPLRRTACPFAQAEVHGRPCIRYGALEAEPDPLRGACARFDGQCHLRFTSCNGIWGARSRSAAAWIRLPPAAAAAWSHSACILSFGSPGHGMKWEWGVQALAGTCGCRPRVPFQPEISANPHTM